MHITRAQRLGIAPLVVAEVVHDGPAILNAIEGLFRGSSFDATHQQILTWSQTILADPNLTTSAAQLAWASVKCWAGDQTMVSRFASAAANGCGCEVSHGCRADAQSAVATLLAHIPTLPPPGALSNAPIPSQVPGYSAAPPTGMVSTSTPYTDPILSTLLPGVPSTVGGVPVLALAIGAGLLLLLTKGSNS